MIVVFGEVLHDALGARPVTLVVDVVVWLGPRAASQGLHLIADLPPHGDAVAVGDLVVQINAALLQGGTATVTVNGTSVSLDKVLEVRNPATS